MGICQLAGARFMSRRVQTEAWPVLLHLLKHGIPEHQTTMYPPGTDSRMLLQLLD